MLYATPYNGMSLDYMSCHPLASLNQVPDLITFCGHCNSSPNSFPISPNLMFVFVAHQCINLLIKGSRAKKDNAYNVLNAVLQLKRKLIHSSMVGNAGVEKTPLSKYISS